MNQLFTNKKDNSIPVYIVQALSEYSTSNFEQKWIEANKLTKLSKKPLILPNEQGVIGTVVCLYHEHDSLFSLGDFYSELPSGHYHLASSHSNEEQFKLMLGFGLGSYRFNEYKQDAPKNITFFLPESINQKALESALHAHFLARTLINRPANDLTPEKLAEIAINLADKYSVPVKSWVGNELLTDNFPLIHAVGKGSIHPPRLVEFVYGDSAHPALTLVGKGVCFDSGGLDLKQPANMRLMKKDMGGAAHVLALADWIMAEKWPVYLRVLVAIVENSPSGSAMRPGDIIKSRNGLTVEIDNTDAEGRLILADALTYAQEHPCDLLIDFATLTGAARVALGPELVALFSTDEQIAKIMMQNGCLYNDPLWQLPLFEAYQDWIKSQPADLINSSTQPYAGAITAALFLKSFITESCPYVHADINAWNIRHRPGRPIGGEAMGLRALYYALAQYFNFENILENK